MSRKLHDPGDDRRIAALMARQHGVVGRRQLTKLGLAEWKIEHRLRIGRLHRLHRGVYSLTAPVNLGIRGHWMAAVLACGSGAVLSFVAAAAHWDLRRSAATLIDVTVPKEGRTGMRGVRVHSSRTLAPSHCTVRGGIPVTTVARTLIDCADVLDRRAVERMLDQAEALRLFDLAAIRAVIAANPGRAGAAVAGRVVAGYDIGAALTESELEDEFLRLCDRHGIPRPETQVRIGQDRVDFVWREQRLVVEVDGWRWHGGRRARDEDHRRDIRLQRVGLRVVRFSYERIFREAGAVASDLIGLLSAAPSAAPRPA
jgi:very-short-patch-repair endonuclease